MNRTSLFVGAMMLMGAAARPAVAQEYPRIKDGLWEYKLVEGATGPAAQAMGAYKVCVDDETQKAWMNMGRQVRRQAGVNCDYERMGPSGNRFTFESLCDSAAGAGKVKVVGIMTFNSDSAYRTEITMTSDAGGGSEKDRRMVADSRFLGPCEAGQKPGDMIFPNGMKMNLLALQGGKPQ